MLKLEDIKIIQKTKDKGYAIIFNDEQIIYLSKRRTIAGLLLLLRYGICSEEDLTGTNGRLQEIKHILQGKIDGKWIQDRYGDANKPFSELWTEEMFSFIEAKHLDGSRKYILHKEDHEKLFNEVSKSVRIQLSAQDQQTILERQNGRCNICGSIVKRTITTRTFAKDRVRLEYDHRIPIDRNGSNELDNFQALCHYCNKCKRQMCYICTYKECNSSCALVSPEKNTVVKATGESIEDRIYHFNSEF